MILTTPRTDVRAGFLSEAAPRNRRDRIDSSATEALLLLHCTMGLGAMAVRIRLPGGTLKMKIYRELRARERERRIPVVKIGSVYLTWWSNSRRPLDSETGAPDDPDRPQPVP